MRPAFLLALAFLLPGSPSSVAAAADASFRHPGVLVNSAQLDLVKQRVIAGAEPQKSAFAALLASPFGALDYTPSPRAIVECGSFSRPDLGCKDERRDATAAWSHALAWHITGNERHARLAIRIMNAWSSTLTGGHTLANGPVQAAWSAALWPRAAEIIRHTSPFWAPEDIARFEKMLREQYVPSLVIGSDENGNKELTMSEALIAIGVFCNDRPIFDAGVKLWRARAPGYIYLPTDGAEPVPPPSGNRKKAPWGNKGKTTPLVAGLLQETMRDPHHANMGFSSMVNAAETAFHQGLDLYAEQGGRMIAAMEYQAQFLPPHSAPPPPNLEFALQPTWEIAFNHFHRRRSVALPLMAKVIPLNRPTGADLNHMAWETLTHGDTGAAGITPAAAAPR
ncbi:MAG: alginate lyase family protein [Opitutaceae bacterium]|nr:alginate lyase family protein [Opitutaceae bacterium]